MLRLLSLRPRDTRHLVHFVDFWIGCNQLDEADRWLFELKKVEPHGLSSLELEVRVLDLRKRRPEVLARLEAFGREFPNEIGTVADLLNRYGFPKEAEQAYRAFVARTRASPADPGIAKFLARQDRVAEAMGIFGKAWSTYRPEDVATAAMSVYDVASADATQRRQVEAWAADAVRKRPDSALLTAGLGTIWIRQGRFDEAEALCRRVLATNPDNVGALNTLAWVLAFRDQAKTKEAIELIDHAVEVLGENPSLVDTRAVARINSGHFDRAVQELLAIRKQVPRNPSFAYIWHGPITPKDKLTRHVRNCGWPRSWALNRGFSIPLERAVFERLRKALLRG